MIALICLNIISNVVELVPHKPIKLTVANQMYIFNGQAHNNEIQFGVVRGTYTITDVPAAHPFTFINIVQQDSLRVVEFDNSTLAGNKTYYFGALKFRVLPTFVSASYESVPPNGTMGATLHKIRRMHMTDPLAKKPKRKTAGSTKESAAIVYGAATLFVGACIILWSNGAYRKMTDWSTSNF